MPSTYSTNNGLTLQATGENNNTWGSICNAETISLIDTSLDGFITLALSGTTSSLAISDGVASDGRNRVILCTGSLAANHTITVTPNDAKKWFHVQNATTGGFNVIISQGGGAGTTVTVANGYWATVRVDGTGSNANATRINNSYEIGGALRSGSLLVDSGTAGAPSISFASDTDTGIYRSAANQVTVAVGGAAVLNVVATGASIARGGSDTVFDVSDTTCNVRFVSSGSAGAIITPTTNHGLTLGANNLSGYLVLNANGSLLSNTGATLTSGGVWTNSCDVAMKSNFTNIDHQDILHKLCAMPVSAWQYKAEEGVIHIGPTAQDFHQTFGFGGSDKGIGTVDGIGVALASIQALHEKLENTWSRRLSRWARRVFRQ